MAKDEQQLMEELEKVSRELEEEYQGKAKAAAPAVTPKEEPKEAPKEEPKEEPKLEPMPLSVPGAMDDFEDDEEPYGEDEDHEDGKEKKQKYEGVSYGSLFIGFVLAALGFGFVLLFSRSTSPLYSQVPMGQSAVYQTVGRSWFKGTLPYTGIFAQSGPLVYLLNGVGFAMFKDRFGVVLLQILALWMTEYYLYRIFRLRFPGWAAMLFTACGLAALAMCYGQGNTVEEWLLPFLTVSCCQLLYWTEDPNGKNTHSLWGGCLYGFTVGLCVLVDPVYAMPVLLGAVLLLIILLFKGELLNMVRLIFCYTFGAAAALLPLGYYCNSKKLLPTLQTMYTDGLWELLAELSGIANPRDYLAYLLNYCWVLALVLGVLISLCCKINGRSWPWLFVALAVGVLLWTGEMETQFAIVTLPMLAVGAVLAAHPRMPKAVGAVFASLIMVAAAGWGGYQGYLSLMAQAQPVETSAVQELVRMIPGDSRGDLVLYDVAPQMYMNEGIDPATHFFADQESLAATQDIAGDLRASAPQWLISTDRVSAIEDVLAENYALVTTLENEPNQNDPEEVYYLYHRIG